MVYQGAGRIKNKKLTEPDRPPFAFYWAVRKSDFLGAFFRGRIVVLVTAGKAKYDLRIVQSLETREIVSVILCRIHR